MRWIRTRTKTAAPGPTSGASDEQRKAYDSLPICRICGERHTFLCPYVSRVTLDAKGEFRVIELRSNFYRDYIDQIPHGPEDIET